MTVQHFRCWRCICEIHDERTHTIKKRKKKKPDKIKYKNRYTANSIHDARRVSLNTPLHFTSFHSTLCCQSSSVCCQMQSRSMSHYTHYYYYWRALPTGPLAFNWEYQNFITSTYILRIVKFVVCLKYTHSTGRRNTHTRTRARTSISRWRIYTEHIWTVEQCTRTLAHHTLSLFHSPVNAKK